MRFTAVVSLHIFLALAIGAAALPRDASNMNIDSKIEGPSHLFFSFPFFSSAFNILLVESSIEFDFEGGGDLSGP